MDGYIPTVDDLINVDGSRVTMRCEHWHGTPDEAAMRLRLGPHTEVCLCAECASGATGTVLKEVVRVAVRDAVNMRLGA